MWQNVAFFRKIHNVKWNILKTIIKHYYKVLSIKHEIYQSILNIYFEKYWKLIIFSCSNEELGVKNSENKYTQLRSENFIKLACTLVFAQLKKFKQNISQDISSWNILCNYELSHYIFFDTSEIILVILGER